MYTRRSKVFTGNMYHGPGKIWKRRKPKWNRTFFGNTTILDRGVRHKFVSLSYTSTAVQAAFRRRYPFCKPDERHYCRNTVERFIRVCAKVVQPSIPNCGGREGNTINGRDIIRKRNNATTNAFAERVFQRVPRRIIRDHGIGRSVYVAIDLRANNHPTAVTARLDAHYLYQWITQLVLRPRPTNIIRRCLFADSSGFQFFRRSFGSAIRFVRLDNANYGVLAARFLIDEKRIYPPYAITAAARRSCSVSFDRSLSITSVFVYEYRGRGVEKVRANYYPGTFFRYDISMRKGSGVIWRRYQETPQTAD